jgi:hypothetical protein
MNPTCTGCSKSYVSQFKSDIRAAIIVKGKRKTIPVTRRGGPHGCETSRVPHFPHNRLTDDGEDVSLTHLPAALYPQEDSWYSFLLEAASTPGPQCC